MVVVCTVAAKGRTWGCTTAYPDEPSKNQEWTLAPNGPCDITKTAACTLRNPTGSLMITVAIIEREGLMQLRLDMDTGTGSAIGAKVCAGTLVVK